MAKKNRKQRQAARAAAGTTTSRPATVRERPRQLTRAERFEAQRRARRRRALRTRFIVWAVALLAAGGLLFNWASDRWQSQRVISSLEAGSCDFDRDTDLGRDHIASPTFRVAPPSGGDHLAAPASARTYQVGNVPGGERRALTGARLRDPVASPRPGRRPIGPAARRCRAARVSPSR